ncbi:MAG TPA: hypothetical protein VEZ16_01530 [Microvirga sp.]|nr:hypothetical protein [Microvirga sp.]
MNSNDRNLHDKLRKLEAIDARMARYEKMTRLTLLLILGVAALALFLLADHILGITWSSGSPTAP